MLITLFLQLMEIHIITVLPELLESPFAHSILKRAQQKEIVQVYVHNLREYSLDKHKSVDDYAFGGGAGMVMMIEPIVRCIEHLQTQGEFDEILYMTPDGERFNQQIANQKCNKVFCKELEQTKSNHLSV